MEVWGWGGGQTGDQQENHKGGRNSTSTMNEGEAQPGPLQLSDSYLFEMDVSRRECETSLCS